MPIRLLLFSLFAIVFANGAALAAKGTPEFGIDQTGTCRDLAVRDIVLGDFVKIGCLDTSNHTFRIDATLAFGNQNQNRFFAAPSGIAGAPTFRAIVDADGPWNFGDNSIRLGPNAGALATGSSGSNIAIGPNTLPLIVESNAMIAIGDRAGAEFTDGALLTGRTLVAIGHVAAMCQDGTASNTAIGGFAMRGKLASGLSTCDPAKKATGSDNTAVGEAAMINLEGDGRSNTCGGFNCLFGLRDGDSNVAYGVGSGLSLLTTCCNSIFGTNAYEWGEGEKNLLLGMVSGAGYSQFTTTTGAIALGATVIAVADTSIFGVGYRVYNGFMWPGLGATVTAVNAGAGTITVNIPNAFDLADSPGGVAIRAIPDPHTGTENVCIGYNTCTDISGDADKNTTIGTSSGLNGKRFHRNTFIGRLTGTTCVTCDDSILIGALTDVPAAGTTNYLNIGNLIYGWGIANALAGDDFLGVSQSNPIYTLDVNGTIAARGTAAHLLLQKNATLSPTAPGADLADLRIMCGTNAGTAKLVAMAGTSTTRFTVLDNIGAGVTGC